MHRQLNRVRPGLVMLLAACLLCGVAPAVRADEPVGSAQQLASSAFQALRTGQFTQTRDLITKAASSSSDPSVRQMADWVNTFDAQRQLFDAQRQKAYDKQVADIHLLLEHGYDSYAIDAANLAYGLAADKDAFTNEPWVRQLIQHTRDQAAQEENSHHWIRALRMYADLAAIEPYNPTWKDKQKLVTRRVQLLALYAPSQLKAMQEFDLKERDAVERLLKPSTQPTTQPEDADDSNQADVQPIDWHEVLHGIQPDMVWDAMRDVQVQYYRDTNYAELLRGGLQGLKTVATTDGLDKTFPGLADQSKRAQFVSALNDAIARENSAGAAAVDQTFVRSAYAQLSQVNHDTVALPDEVLAREFAEGAFARLDPFTNVIWPYDLDDFERQTQGEFSGVGIQIQNDHDGRLKVVTPIPDSPAWRAGIRPDDVITHVDGRKIKGISLNQAVKLITGPEQTLVTLTVRSPDGAVRDYPIRREIIKVGSVKGWRLRSGGAWDYFIDPTQKIAYLRITSFSRSTEEDFNQALDSIQADGARGIILDLRYNPGGLMVAATEMCDRLLHGGVIVSTHADRDTPNPPSVTMAKDDSTDCDLPLVVLVNQYSASASEIVAGALKDRHRALLVGERTFGKGSVQILFPLPGHQSMIKLTTSHYYLPSGRCIHREENSTVWGVDPDITIDMTPEQMAKAIDVRQDNDVVRDPSAPAPNAPDTRQSNPQPGAASPNAAPPDAKQSRPQANGSPTVAQATQQDPLSTDPQLSAALLLLRLQVTGDHI